MLFLISPFVQLSLTSFNCTESKLISLICLLYEGNEGQTKRYQFNYCRHVSRKLPLCFFFIMKIILKMKEFTTMVTFWKLDHVVTVIWWSFQVEREILELSCHSKFAENLRILRLYYYRMFIFIFLIYFLENTGSDVVTVYIIINYC